MAIREYSSIQQSRPSDNTHSHIPTAYTPLTLDALSKKAQGLSVGFGQEGMGEINQGDFEVGKEESERERRLRLREMERMRRNQGQSEGLRYGAMQGLPPQLIRPESKFKLNQDPSIPSQNIQLPIDKRNLGEEMIVQNPQRYIPSVYPVQSQQIISPPIPQDIFPPNKSVEFNMLPPTPPKIHQKPQSVENSGFLVVGRENELDEKRREIEKRQKQMEYKQFLEKQEQEKRMKQMSPNSLRERINSARRNQQELQEQSTLLSGESPNKSRRPLVKSTSQSGQKNQFNILGQLQETENPFKTLPRTDSASGLRGEKNGNNGVLIQGGINAIGLDDQKRQEDKAKKQKEYRDFLDKQKNNQIVSDRPISTPSKPPTGKSGQMGGPTNFMSQGMSINDEEYLKERRKQISDQVFQELLKNNPVQEFPPSSQRSGIGNKSQPEFLPDIRRSHDQDSGFKQRINSANRRNIGVFEEPSHHNPFVRSSQQESEMQNVMAEKKKEYAIFLQQQMQDKNKKSVAQKMPVNQPFRQPESIGDRGMAFGYQPEQQIYQEGDQRWQEILGQKRQDLMSLPSYQQDMPAQSYIQPSVSMLSEQDVIRQKKEEQRKMLDEQMKERQAKRQSTNQPLNEMVTQRPPSARQHVSLGRARTDVTRDGQNDQNEQLKRQAYQEELRRQIEEQQRKKEEEKIRRKMEDERFERQLEEERKMMEMREKGEIVKEGKRDVNPQSVRPPRQVNRKQFQTSDEINQQIPDDIPVQVQQPEPPQPQYQPFQIPRVVEDDRRQEELLMEEYRRKLESMRIESEFKREEDERNQQMRNQVSTNDKLLEDQQKMIEMYQHALQQILDFRNQYFKEAMEMQMNMLRERESIFNQGVQFQQKRDQFRPTQFGALIGFSQDEQAKQFKEIQQLQAVQTQLGNLKQQANNQIDLHATNPLSGFTPVMNPQVQQNLNKFIVTQRDQMVRMSQSFKQGAVQIQDDRNIDFDQSLESRSKLIKVPKNITNNLVQVAQNFEMQKYKSQQQSAGIQGGGYLQSPTKSNLSQPGLYQTWIQNDSASASMNERVIGSPEKSTPIPYSNQMQQSLQGSSHLVTGFQDRQSPLKKHNQQSPFSAGRRQYFPPQDTIQELPEREQNIEESKSLKENQILINQRVKIPPPPKKPLQSVDTDQDMNNRDESIHMSGFPEQRREQGLILQRTIEQNLQFIENQVNQGVKPLNHPNSPSHIQVDGRLIAITPQMAANMVKVGDLLKGNQLQSVLRGESGEVEHIEAVTNTQKSFFKGSAASGFGYQIQKQISTGSSFYNQTMEKTRLKEQAQKEEYEKQLLKIFSENPYQQEQQLPESKFEEEDIDQLSDINIAQSEVNNSIAYHPVAAIELKQEEIKDSKKVGKFDQQYNWMLDRVSQEEQKFKHMIDQIHHHQDQDVIQELQDEYKSKTEEPTSTIKTDIQIQTNGSQLSYITSAFNNQPQKNQDFEYKKEQALWDDPDLNNEETLGKKEEVDSDVDKHHGLESATEEEFEVIQESGVSTRRDQMADSNKWGKGMPSAHPYENRSIESSKVAITESQYNLGYNESEEKQESEEYSEEGEKIEYEKISKLNPNQFINGSQGEDEQIIDEMFQASSRGRMDLLQDEEDLELKDKFNKINSIFNQGINHAEDSQLSVKVEERSEEVVGVKSKAGRGSEKQKELEELARLIEAATGSINDAIESSIMDQSRVHRRVMDNKGQQRDEEVSQITMQDNIDQKIKEDRGTDKKILNELDEIIKNLEQKQKQSMLQSTSQFHKTTNPKLEEYAERHLTTSKMGDKRRDFRIQQIDEGSNRMRNTRYTQGLIDSQRDNDEEDQ